MGFLQPLSTWTDLVVVAFLLGVGAGALIFWPMVRKARHRLAAQRACTYSLSRGAHALRDPSAMRLADSTTTSATAVTVLAAQRRSSAPDRQADEHASDAPEPAEQTTTDQANADLPTAPQPRICEPVAVPQLPTDLFEQHYEARFEHARKRIERLRAQLD